MRRVAIVGVGNMGGAMCQRILDQRWPVQVFDVDPAKMAAMQARGAVPRPDAAQASVGCGVLVVCVVDSVQVEDVLFGPRGAASVMRASQTVVLCPTISPVDVEKFAARLSERGIAVVDAPMSGGPARARDGTMSLMVACDDAVFERQKAVLEILSSRIFRISQKPGDGARTKLVNNLLAGINLAGAAEAMALAQRLGLDLTKTLQVIEQSSAQSWIGSDRMKRAIAGDYEPRAHVTLLQKDTTLAVEMAAVAGFQCALGPVARDIFENATRAGLGDLDDAALFRLYAEQG